MSIAVKEKSISFFKTATVLYIALKLFRRLGTNLYIYDKEGLR